VNILLVDDHPMISNALQIILERQPEPYTLRYESNFSVALERLAKQPGTDLVLLDLSLPGFEGTRALVTFRQRFPEIRVAVISGEQDPVVISDCIGLGACGYVPKSIGSTAILNAIRSIADGGIYMPGRDTEQAYTDPLAVVADRFHLTPRQQEVLGLLIKAKSNRDIASELDLSVNTVAVHVSAVFSALSVRNRTELIGVAANLGLLPTGSTHN
jgi:DNA-binding NarL/FixJ family response regulator